MKIVDGHILHRIQADRDIPFHGVKVGDVGGWVEKPNNLQDDAWVTCMVMLQPMVMH